MIRFGILGAGKIAHRFAKALNQHPKAILYAVANRTIEKAKAFQQDFPCEKAYESYEELLDDPNVDAVYIAVPHGYHYLYTLQAMRKGKAVLCEKPLAINQSEVEGLMACQKQHPVLLMEAMKTLFIPCTKAICEQLKQMGKIDHIYASLCSFVDDDHFHQSYLSDPIQGGGLLDCGIYCAAWLCLFLEEPYTIEQVEYRLKDGVDAYVCAKIRDQKRTYTLETALDIAKPKICRIETEKGMVTIENLHRPTKYMIDQQTYEIAYDHDDFYSQIDHFITLYDDHQIQSPIVPLTFSHKMAKLLDAIRMKIQ